MNNIVSLSSFNLLFFTQVLSVLTSSIKYNTNVTDKGKNISIPCEYQENVVWRKFDGKNTTIFQRGQYLQLINVTTGDSGVYICFDSVSRAILKVNLTVRSTPGPVSQLYFKASTILGFLIWRFDKINSGGHPLKSFTAEFRNLSHIDKFRNDTHENLWIGLDPKNIAPNVRQMEVYRLEPNTSYEFRIWANNVLGSGDVVTTTVTTLAEYKEDDLIRLIKPDLDKFDPRIWVIAVSIVLGTLVILAIGLCVVLSKECYQTSDIDYEEDWDSIELIPNIIINPGFNEYIGSQNGVPQITRTIIFGDDDDDSASSDVESDHEPAMEKFKRKVSVFFTGPTIKRI